MMHPIHMLCALVALGCSGPSFKAMREDAAPDGGGHDGGGGATEDGTLVGASYTAEAMSGDIPGITGPAMSPQPELTGSSSPSAAGTGGGAMTGSGGGAGQDAGPDASLEPSAASTQCVGVGGGSGVDAGTGVEAGGTPGSGGQPEAAKIPCTLTEEDQGQGPRLMHSECPTDLPYCQRHGYCGNDEWESPECTKPGYDFRDVDNFHCTGRCNIWLVCVED